MKPTELHKRIIDICISEMQCWKDSNDIKSPTHYCDGEVALYELDYDGELDQESCDEVNKALQKLRYAIYSQNK